MPSYHRRTVIIPALSLADPHGVFRNQIRQRLELISDRELVHAANGNDACVLYKWLKKDLPTILAIHGMTGLNFNGSEFIWVDNDEYTPEEIAKIKNYHTQNYRLQPFIWGDIGNRSAFSDFLVEIEPDAVYTAEFFNNKKNLLSLARDLGLSIPETQFCDKAEDILEFVVEDIKISGNTVVFKPDVGAAGAQIRFARNLPELKNIAAKFTEISPNTPVHIQQALPSHTDFFGVAYRESNRKAVPLRVTRQLLKGSVHVGNTFTGEYDRFFKPLQPLAQHIIDQGLIGNFGFDLGYNPVTGDIWVMECNSRCNGTTYLDRHARKRNFVGQFIGTTCETPCKTLDEFATLFEKSRVRYQVENQEGLVVTTMGGVCHPGERKFAGFMIAGPQERWRNIVETAALEGLIIPSSHLQAAVDGISTAENYTCHLQWKNLQKSLELQPLLKS